MRYLWTPFSFLLWSIPTAIITVLWPDYVRQAFGTLGLQRVAGAPPWLQPMVLVPALAAIALMVGGVLLAPRWREEINLSDRLTWHRLTGGLFTLAGAAGMLAVGGFIALGWRGLASRVWGLDATPVMIAFAVVALVSGLLWSAQLHGAVHRTLVRQLTRRSPLTPGYRVFTGTVVPLAPDHLVGLPLVGGAAVGWYLEVFQVRRQSHQVTRTVTERDVSSPTGERTTTEHNTVYTKSKERDIVTHDLVPFAVAVAGGEVLIPDTAGFDGVPVTDELRPAASMGEVYNLVRSDKRKVDNGTTLRIVALLPGARVEVAGLVWLDDQGRARLADHPLDNAYVTAL